MEGSERASIHMRRWEHTFNEESDERNVFMFFSFDFFLTNTKYTLLLLRRWMDSFCGGCGWDVDVEGEWKGEGEERTKYCVC